MGSIIPSAIQNLFVDNEREKISSSRRRSSCGKEISNKKVMPEHTLKKKSSCENFKTNLNLMTTFKKETVANNKGINMDIPNKIYKNINLPNFFFKPIITNGTIEDIENTSFINSVLNSFAFLKYINGWINNISNFPLRQNAIITKELYLLYCSLYKGMKSDSNNFILHYYNKLPIVYKGDKQKDPYHFLYYLLDLIHLENNCLNPNNCSHLLNQRPIDYQMDSNYMYDLFMSWLNQSHNSIISNYFFNIIKNEKMINNTKVYFYLCKTIIKFDLNKITTIRNKNHPEKAKFKLTLDECFEYYSKIKNVSSNSYFYSFICQSAMILIIALYRKSHSNKCDIKFNDKIKLKNHPVVSKNSFTRILQYNLRVCISFDTMGDYFSDLSINNIWFRFYKNEVFRDINIHEFEPQVLIYELDETTINNLNNNNNFNNNFNNNNNFNININFNNNFNNNITPIMAPQNCFKNPNWN